MRMSASVCRRPFQAARCRNSSSSNTLFSYVLLIARCLVTSFYSHSILSSARLALLARLTTLIPNSSLHPCFVAHDRRCTGEGFLPFV